MRFSEPVFTDNPASGGNPAVISGTADTDITYTNTVAGGTTTFSATDTGTGQSFLLNGTGSGNSYVVLALTGATAVADLFGGITDDTIDVTGATHIYDTNGTPMATGGTVALRTLNDTLDPVILSVTRNNTSNQNTLAIVYSEDVTITGAPAAGASQASTAAIGDLITAGTLAGFGAFGTVGDVTYRTLGNTVALDSGGTTFTITFAGQSLALKTAGSTQPSGTFTPTINVVDLAPTPNALETTSLQGTLTETGAWDLTAPTSASSLSVTGSGAVNISLNFSPASPPADFQRYEVYYRQSTSGTTFGNGTAWTSAGDGNLALSGTTATSVTGLNTGYVYYLVVYTIDIDGNPSVASNEVNVMTSSVSTADSTAPLVPTAVAATVNADGKVVLTWTDPTAADLKSIAVLRGKNGLPISGLPYATVLKAVKTYTDTDVAASDKLEYYLKALDTSNNMSGLSILVVITIPATVATPPAVITPPPAEVAPPAEEKPALSEKIKRN